MGKGFKQVFEIANKYIVLATPLILFSLISSVYLAASATGKVINIIVSIVLFVLMSAAFVAGWFNMVKLSVSNPDSREPNSLMKEFLPGVGEYFLPALGSFFNFFLLTALIVYICFILGAKYIGDPGVSAEALSKALETAQALKAFLSGLSAEQLMKLNCWNLLLMSGLSFSYFLVILYLPAMFYKKKNPFVAFFYSIKDLFSKKIFKTIALYLLIFFVNAFISVLSALFIGNVIMHFIITLLNFYFITVAAVGIFYYYYKNFVEPQLGQNVDLRI